MLMPAAWAKQPPLKDTPKSECSESSAFSQTSQASQTSQFPAGAHDRRFAKMSRKERQRLLKSRREKRSL
ncbi:MAG: hypothetical protein WCV67_01520 [Victivallaceae bacterium]